MFTELGPALYCKSLLYIHPPLSTSFMIKRVVRIENYKTHKFCRKSLGLLEKTTYLQINSES